MTPAPDYSSKSKFTDFYLIIVTTLIIAISEAIIIFLLHIWPELSGLGRVALEIIQLVTLTVPALFIFILRPLLNHLAERRRAQESLHEAYEQMETKVAERTEDLQKALQNSEQREAEVTSLLKGARAVLEQREFEITAQQIFRFCKNLIGAQAGYVALLSKDRSENEVLFLDPGGAICTVDQNLPMPIRGLREKVYATGQALFENQFLDSPYTQFLPAGHVALQNVLFAPLQLEGKVVGLLGLANKDGGFTENDRRMASAFGEQAAIALLNSRMLESLENNEKKFRAVAQSATDAIININYLGNIVFWNVAANKIFGYSADDVMGKPLTFLIPPKYRQQHQAALERVLATGQSDRLGTTMELSALRKDGSEFPIGLSLSGWNLGAEKYFTGIVRDISDQKQLEHSLRKSKDELEERVQERTRELSATNTVLRNEILERETIEKALLASEQRLRLLVNSMNDSVFTLDREQKVIEIYGNLVAKPGIYPPDLIGKPLNIIFNPRDLITHQKAAEQALRGESTVYEWELAAADAKSVVQTSLSPMYDAQGKINAVVGVARDITRQKILEKQSIQTEKLLTLAEISAMISHEFRNSLTSVRMIMELQLESPQLTPPEKESLSVALGSILHMENIVSELLNFSRPSPAVFKSGHINTIVEESISLVTAQIKKEQINLVLSLDPALPEINFDYMQLKEAVINLIMNAINAIISNPKQRTKREIMLVTRKYKMLDTLRELPVALSSEDHVNATFSLNQEIIFHHGETCILLEIKDSGIGIKPEIRERIFEPFFTTMTKGTGLGLAMVKRTIYIHGGIIRVDSIEGKGTAFTIYLPLPGKNNK